jgi:hypothetical protein
VASIVSSLNTAATEVRSSIPGNKYGRGASVVTEESSSTSTAAAAAPSAEATNSDTTTTDTTAASTPAATTAVSTLSAAHSARVTSSLTVTIPTIASGVVSLALTTVVQLVQAVIVSAVSVQAPSITTATPTLTLDGYSLVPSSTETVTSISPQWTYLPGAPSMVQGEQEFNVVDPTTSESVGTFTALVGRANSFDYTVLLVTANDGINVGTAAGQVPPVGSLIATFMVGSIGWTYSSMPSESGDVISFKLITPLGDIAIPLSFDAAEGIADGTVDNEPIDLGNGYSIAPADPSGETITATSGILPLYTTVQGTQTFNIYEADGNVVGSFGGVFTTTKDILGTHTEAILVTSNDGINVGTAAGQVPPVGTVYNVIYPGSSGSHGCTHPCPRNRATWSRSYRSVKTARLPTVP